MQKIVRSDILLIFSTLLVMPICAIICPWFGVCIMFFLCAYGVIKNNNCTLLFFVCVIFIQNITLLVGANNFDSKTTTLYSLLKEMMLYACIIYAIICKGKLRKEVMYVIPYVLVILVSFVLSEASNYAKIVSIRQLFLPFVCFLFGLGLDITKEQIYKIGKIIVYMGVIVSIFGLIEVFLLGDTVWNNLPMWKYQVNKGTTFRFTDGLPTNFWTFDLILLTGSKTRRLVSMFVDPLLTAHFLFLCFCLIDICVQKNKKKMKLVIFVSSILTLSKGVILAYLFYFSFFVLKKFSYKQLKKSLKYGIVFLIMAFYCIYIFTMKYMSNSSIAIHMNGFIKGILNGKVIGMELGRAGIMTSILSSTKESMLTAESYIGTLVTQLGYVGLAIFVLYWLRIIFILLKKSHTTNNKLCYITFILLVSVFIESLFSESSIAIVGNGLWFILAGICIKIQKTKVVCNDKE